MGFPLSQLVLCASFELFLWDKAIMDTKLTALTFDTECRCCYVMSFALKPSWQMRFLKGSSQISRDCVGQIGRVKPDLDQYILNPHSSQHYHVCAALHHSLQHYMLELMECIRSHLPNKGPSVVCFENDKMIDFHHMFSIIGSSSRAAGWEEIPHSLPSPFHLSL